MKQPVVILASDDDPSLQVGSLSNDGSVFSTGDDLGLVTGGAAKELVLAIPSKWCLWARLDAGEQGTPTREELTYLLEEQLPLSAEDVVADFCGDGPDVFAVALDPRRARETMNQLDPRGITIGVISPASLLALQHRLEEIDGQVDAVIWEDEKQIELFVLKDGRPIAWHVAPAGGEMADEPVSIFLRAALPTNHNRLRIILSGDCPAVRRELADLPEIDVAEKPLGSIREAATQAADRVLRGKLTPWFDLHRGALASGDPHRAIRRPLNLAVAALFVCCACVAAAMFWRSARYGALESQYAQQQAAVFQKVLPGRPIPPDVTARLASEEQRLLAMSGGHGDGSAASASRPRQSSVLPALFDLLSRLPSGSQYQITQVRLDGAKLYVEGRAKAHGDADALAGALRAGGRFPVGPPHTESTAQGVLFTLDADAATGQRPADKALDRTSTAPEVRP
jgi:hypothetical protein